MSTNNNQVYQATVSGSIITWVAQPAYPGSAYSPVNGNVVQILEGNSFANQIGIFKCTEFEFNNAVRYFNSNLEDYFEQDAIATSTLLNDSSGVVFTTSGLSSENIIIDFSISRGASPPLKKVGTISLTTDGLNAFVSLLVVKHIPV